MGVEATTHSRARHATTDLIGHVLSERGYYRVRSRRKTCRRDTFLACLSLLIVSVCARRSIEPPTLAAPARDIRGKMPVSEALVLPMRNRPIVVGRQAASSGFARLLTRLHSDPDQAAAEYQRLRRTLERFFDWQCAWPPEECADETLDRLVSKLAADVKVDDVRAYARGIARLVLLEWRRRPAPVSMDESRDYAVASLAMHEEDPQDLSSCFERCLAALSDETRSLVLDYYVDERGAKIDNRRRLARRLGLSESALRNRVQRVRNRLERCVQRCTSLSAEIGLEAAMKEAAEANGSDDQ
jgi:DNA-directed RNA polymerase specialized sigma24 family protein